MMYPWIDPQRAAGRGPRYSPWRTKAVLVALVSVCKGGGHGWFRIAGSTSLVRKPFDADTINWTPEEA